MTPNDWIIISSKCHSFFFKDWLGTSVLPHRIEKPCCVWQWKRSGSSSEAHFFTTIGEIPSGPAALLIFSLQADSDSDVSTWWYVGGCFPWRSSVKFFMNCNANIRPFLVMKQPIVLLSSVIGRTKELMEFFLMDLAADQKVFDLVETFNSLSHIFYWLTIFACSIVALQVFLTRGKASLNGVVGYCDNCLTVLFLGFIKIIWLFFWAILRGICRYIIIHDQVNNISNRLRSAWKVIWFEPHRLRQAGIEVTQFIWQRYNDTLDVC